MYLISKWPNLFWFNIKLSFCKYYSSDYESSKILNQTVNSRLDQKWIVFIHYPIYNIIIYSLLVNIYLKISINILKLVDTVNICKYVSIFYRYNLKIIIVKLLKWSMWTWEFYVEVLDGCGSWCRDQNGWIWWWCFRFW